MQTTLLAFESFRIHLFREVVVLAFFSVVASCPNLSTFICLPKLFRLLRGKVTENNWIVLILMVVKNERMDETALFSLSSFDALGFMFIKNEKTGQVRPIPFLSMQRFVSISGGRLDGEVNRKLWKDGIIFAAIAA